MTVTVGGGGGETIVLPFGSARNAVIGQALADAVSTAVKLGTLKAVDYTGGALPPALGNEEIVIKAVGPLVLASQAKAVVDVAT